MPLNLTVSAEDYESLPEVIQNEYTEKDGSYVLDVSGIEDTGALKRAKEHEKTARKEAEKRARLAENKVLEFQDEASRKAGDVEALEKSWQGKLETREAELLAKLEAKDKYIGQQLVDNVALQIATEISKSPSLILPHIKSRLTADLDSENPVTKVLDANNQLSALTIDELKQEFIANKDFAPIIIGSKASGSGTSSDAPSASLPTSNMDLSKMSPKDLAAHMKAKKQLQE